MTHDLIAIVIFKSICSFSLPLSRGKLLLKKTENHFSVPERTQESQECRGSHKRGKKGEKTPILTYSLQVHFQLITCHLKTTMNVLRGTEKRFLSSNFPLGLCVLLSRGYSNVLISPKNNFRCNSFISDIRNALRTI